MWIPTPISNPTSCQPQARAREFEVEKSAHAAQVAQLTKAIEAAGGDATSDEGGGVIATTSVTWTSPTGEQHETTTRDSHRCVVGQEASRYTVSFQAPNNSSQLVALVEVQEPEAPKADPAHASLASSAMSLKNQSPPRSRARKQAGPVSPYGAARKGSPRGTAQPSPKRERPPVAVSPLLYPAAVTGDGLA